MKPCYLKMCDSSYGLMYYPDREVPLDLYFAKRPYTHEGYKVCFEVPKKHQEFLDEKVKDYQERYSNKPMRHPEGTKNMSTISTDTLAKISQMCTNISNVQSEFYDDPNGPYSATCPLCDSSIQYPGNVPHKTMNDIDHDADCPWIMAPKILDELDD